MMWRRFMIVLAINLTVGVLGHAKEKVLKLTVDPNKVTKDLTRSLVGYDGEDFWCGSNFNWMLNEGRDEFKKMVKKAGVSVIRLAEMSHYDWRGEPQTRTILNHLRRYKLDKVKWWFEPKKFWDFCRENNIKVIPMLAARAYYDPASKKAYKITNDKTQYARAAKNAAEYVAWVKANNYLDMVPMWEIGNECYGGWKAEEFAEYIRHVVDEVRKVDPKIKLAVSTFICTVDNPDVKMIMDRVNATSKTGPKSEWLQYMRWSRWTMDMVQSLDDYCKYIDYGVVHSYGANRSYNSNYKGQDTTYKLLQGMPQSRHWKLINTEWRDRSGEDLLSHRRFRTNALWKTKFTLTLMSYPPMEYSTTHSIFAWGGGMYWSNGKTWGLQRQKDGRSIHKDVNGDGKPRFDFGSYGVVTRMCNELMLTHPQMLVHHAERGNMSSAIYYDSYVSKRAKALLTEAVQKKLKTDLEWMVATNKEKDSYCCMFVNTGYKERVVDLDLGKSAPKITKQVSEVLSCPVEDLDKLHVLGGKKPFWTVTKSQTETDPSIIRIPANSVMKVLLTTAK